MASTEKVTLDQQILQPWKNGRGETRQIAIWPRGSDFLKAQFVWRVSTARVSESGPFSLFQNYDRTLFLLEGSGLEVDCVESMAKMDSNSAFGSTSADEIGGGSVNEGGSGIGGIPAGESATATKSASATKTATATGSECSRTLLPTLTQAVQFSGDAIVRGRLSCGPVIDFNVFAKRGAVKASVQILECKPGASLQIAPEAPQWLVFAADSTLTIDLHNEAPSEPATKLSRRPASERPTGPQSSTLEPLEAWLGLNWYPGLCFSVESKAGGRVILAEFK